MTKQIKLAVGLPHYQGRSSFEHCRMWLEFGAVINESSERFKLVAFALVDECGIDRARNKCVEAAREADADWLLMIDSDTWVSDGGDLLQMISDADRRQFTVVGAAVPRRNLNRELPTLMVYDAPKEHDPNLAALALVSLTMSALLNRKACDSYVCSPMKEDEFANVDAMATACIALNMRHVEFMEQPFFRFTDIESEDIDFCRRVREMRGGWMKLDDFGKPSPTGCEVPWQGVIAVDKRVMTRHLNRPTILRGLDR